MERRMRLACPCGQHCDGKDKSIQWLKRVTSEEQPTEPADFRRFDRPRAELLLEQFSK